ncbi:MAG: GDSL-type esterase/lipase family protein [Boseongicola sp.]
MRRALCFGDSNTYGCGPTPALGYRVVLQRGARWGDVLSAGLGDGWEVVVEGLPGRTTVFDDPVEGEYRNGLRSMRAILESHQPIDVLIICLGTNDMKLRMGLGPQDIALGVQRLVDEASSLGIIEKILVVCPPLVKERGDLAEMFKGAEERFVGTAAQMERFTREIGADFMDAGALIAVDEIDGVHWNAESHAILGRAVADKVRAMIS